MTQALVSQLFALPSEAVQGGRLAHLPAPSTALPREKPIPKAKPLTKWQKFAQVTHAIDRVPAAAAAAARAAGNQWYNSISSMLHQPLFAEDSKQVPIAVWQHHACALQQQRPSQPSAALHRLF
jgi:hypothetical protein